jgi:biotin carboxyl carrier protein
MKLQARVRDHVHTLEVTREGASFEVRIDGVLQALDLIFSDTSHDVMLVGNSCYDVVSVPKPGGYQVNVYNRIFEIDVLDPKQLASGSSKASGLGDGTVRAAMPGRVVKVLVAEGDEVTAGQGLLLLEAMKMQNEIRSPRPGRVTGLAVSPGDTVEAGRLLLTVVAP